MNHSCTLCRKYNKLDKLTGQIVFETEHFVVIHQQPPVYVLGWLIILPKEHMTDQLQLTKIQTAELIDLQMKFTRILTELTKAERIYWVMFSEKVKHIHFHLVPVQKDLVSEARGHKIFEWEGEKPVSELEIDGFCDYLIEAIKSKSHSS